ncbi:MAG: DUF2723 domain-containing protein [Bacteroidota bacterium]
MKKFEQINTRFGFGIFAFATAVYWLCMEPTVSFWDCGEFIAAAFKLEVGHQPGAPLFLMIGKLFSLLAGGNTAKVAYWVNFVSVISSAATIMFLFWSINAIALKIIKKSAAALSPAQVWSIMAAGTIGALAYTFSDTFWFSAVEAEVYAISTLCTAIVFWAILKWESEMNDKWLLFIAFTIGLSIGMHLLSLLAIPAVTLIYYFNKTAKATLWGTLKAFLIGCFLLGLIQFGVIQYFVLFAAKADLLFVNTFGLGFGSGALAFIALVIVGLAYAIRYSIKKRRYNLNLGLLSLVFVLFGFSSYFMIAIRANAKTNINLSNPDTPISLFGYLSRTQYEEKPLLYGQFFDSKVQDIKETSLSYRKGEKKYEVTGKTYKREYDKNTFFPRTYSDKPAHVAFYKSWMDLADNQTPTFWQNLSFFNSYQLGFMYWRYFSWNFIGRQNDEQGQGSITQGNWLSGIKPIDALHLGNQSKLPPSIAANQANNLFYGLPLLLGILGLVYLWQKNKKDALVIGTLFFCTGIAIILYINQDPLQVRERDYAYVGSFYAFAMVIGIGFLAVKDLVAKWMAQKLSFAIAASLCLIIPVIMATQGWDDHNRSGKTTALDMAKNYLNSCEPNAILFTNADNDTYPLWYAQEVEGIRTDVRVVNLQFLSSEPYIDQLKKQQLKSAALPISLSTKQYKEGTHDYLPYYDYGIKDSVELSDLLAILVSENQDDKIKMNDGSYENFMPTQKLKLSVDPNQIIATNTLPATDRAKIAPQLEWNFNKQYVLKSDLAMFDILVHNNWKRPVYFAASVSEDTYLGLDKYLYLEGFAYRLLPLKPNQDANFSKEEQTHSALAYRHYVHQFELDGFKNAKYLDPESRRVMQGTLTFANTLAANLIKENKAEMAQEVMKKTLAKIPLHNSSIADTVNKIALVQNLYQLKDQASANQIVLTTATYIDKEFDYLLSLKPAAQSALINDVKTGFFVLQQLDQLATNHKQEALSELLKLKLKDYESRFAKSLG